MIDEKVLIAEINKRIKALKNKKKDLHFKAWDWSIDTEINDYKSILSFIDSLQEELVSEELENNAIQYAGKHAPYDDAMDEVKEAFKAGANWQKEQDQSIIELAEDHAMLAGMEKMKEQMMANAVEQDVDSIWANPINTLERLGLQNFNGKVKLIIIKEE